MALDRPATEIPSETTSQQDNWSGQTPRALGYRMPAEWEPHAATWLSWPHKEASWPGNFTPIPRLYAHLVRTLARHEPVHILAGGESLFPEVSRLFQNQSRVTVHDVRTDDAWLRDSGPIFLNGKPGAPPALINWGYNAWGGKYPPYELDDLLPTEIAALTGRNKFTPGIILEGGAIDVNGRGTLITTEQCLLNPNRNPHLDRASVEKYLTDYLNVTNILWLGAGIVGDDTDGHIDELARFVNPTTVVAAVEEDPTDENYAALQDNLRRLKSFSDQDGQPLTIIPLPLPRAMDYEGQRLPASYCNFYIANGAVLVPQFGDPADHAALDILRPLFPGREVLGLFARELAWGLGAFHCITQQEPRLAGG
ncbi:MAG: agmatine deiminase family protein [Pirellulales bacterium]|nr:agmatine deiminase family protein [Pirellulales bacterium]